MKEMKLKCTNWLSTASLLLPRSTKRIIVAILDMFLLPAALYASFLIRFGELSWDVSLWWRLFVAVPIITFPVFLRLQLYRFVMRHMGLGYFVSLAKALALSSALLFLAGMLLGEVSLPRSVFIIFFFTSFSFLGLLRLAARKLANIAYSRECAHSNTIIYGAGATGAYLCKALTDSAHYLPVAFIDDNRDLWGSIIYGLRIHPLDNLPDLMDKHDVSRVILALPSISRQRRSEIMEHLSQYQVEVKIFSGLAKALSDGDIIKDIREVEIEDILGRDIISPDYDLMKGYLEGKSVLVTGAGGSIGSELCRQIAKGGARRLVLYEVSEFALYSIEKDLRTLPGTRQVEIISVLGSVCDRDLLERILRINEIEFVYHAAAYKHVPIVEQNAVQGVVNNVLGSLRAVEASMAAGVRLFMLISTDKAVRPTNIMGATKRLSELILQAYAQAGSCTRLSIVRFGNVLGSSGSVVPLFRQQIKGGGPVTVTHPDITRFFMTIPEAVQLVLQAGAMAAGGEVFVLNMGAPVKIVDLARKMIKLSGLKVRDASNPVGDIEIRFVGLRPGEKLHEELFIGSAINGTAHPMILQASETSTPLTLLKAELDRLEDACRRLDVQVVRDTLERLVDGYTPGQCAADRLCRPADLEGFASRGATPVASMKASDPMPELNVGNLEKA